MVTDQKNQAINHNNQIHYTIEATINGIRHSINTHNENPERSRSKWVLTGLTERSNFLVQENLMKNNEIPEK